MQGNNLASRKESKQKAVELQLLQAINEYGGRNIAIERSMDRYFGNPVQV